MGSRLVSLQEVRGIGAGIVHKAFTTIQGYSQERPLRIYGIPRGGIVPAYVVLETLLRAGESVCLVDTAEEAHIIVDDIVDSGATCARYRQLNPQAMFIHFFTQGSDWLVFPWEGTDIQSAEDIPLRLIQFIGEDPTREGLRDTPRRFLEAMRFWTSGYAHDPKEVLRSFQDGAEQYDELVFQGNIPIYSLCEHHLAPFFGVAHIGYIPQRRIVGLSKLSRLVDVFARRLQVQERLTSQIAEFLMSNLQALGVGVVLRCRHLCMESRGVQRVGICTTTSSMLGVFRDKPVVRSEFLQLLKSGCGGE